MDLGFSQELTQRQEQRCSICDDVLDAERTRKRQIDIALFGRIRLEEFIKKGNCPAYWCLSDTPSYDPDTIEALWGRWNRWTTWGEWYGRSLFITPRGRQLRLYRKGQRCRFYDGRGRQVGPEQSNVAPALAFAAYMKWRDVG